MAPDNHMMWMSGYQEHVKALLDITWWIFFVPNGIDRNNTIIISKTDVTKSI